MKPILLCIVMMAACSVASLAEETIPGETLSSVTATFAKKTWKMRLNVQPSVRFTGTIDGHDFVQDSAVLQLYKEPVAVFGSKHNLLPKLVWTTADPSQGVSPKKWSGAICMDNKTGKLYLAVSDGYSLEIYITDLNATAAPIPLKDQWTVVNPTTSQPSQVSLQKINFPPSNFTTIGEITRLSVVKLDNSLLVTLDTGSQGQQQWSYSLTKQDWNRLPARK